MRWQDPDAGNNGRPINPARRSGSETPDGPPTVRPFVYYPVDHGTNRQVGYVNAGSVAYEDEVVEFADGSVLLDAR